MKKTKNAHYVNNKEFLAAMVEYREKVTDWKKHTNSGDKNTRPRVPNYIGECIMKIATHLSHKPNFINYTFRDEMICDGIENCLQYIDNFDPEKSSNPFAYFTQIIYYAFLRRIQKEKKLLYTKYKLTENANVMDETTSKQAHDIGKNYNDQIKASEWSQEYMSNFISDFEDNKRRQVKKRIKRKEGLDQIIGD
tara:strand:+ start:9625 stop:10206 length:582 start_codon:yes stop_codon:yes gene_type:complete